MKAGLVGYQAGGKSSLFELLTGVKPDPSKTHVGQHGMAVVPDERFDGLVELFRPRKISPAKIELVDTPGLSRDRSEANAQRLGIIRESAVIVHVIGAYAGFNPLADARALDEELILADLQAVTNRIERLEKDAKKPRPDREELHTEREVLEPVAGWLGQGRPAREMSLTDRQHDAIRSFSLFTMKQQLLVINTSESAYDEELVAKLAALGTRVVVAPVGLELEVQALPEVDRDVFANELGLAGSSRKRLLRAIFEITDQILFFTANEQEVHAWTLKRGSTALDAAGSIHSDLARGFIRAEIMPVADLLRLGSEREVKAAGLHHVEGKDYEIQDGDELLVRFSV